MKKPLVVVIPIYQKELNFAEKKSVSICIDKLGKRYDIFFIVPNSLSMENYAEYSNIPKKRFDDRFFKSTDTYNKLMLDPKFYAAFGEYEYMLIAQTDTLILNDGVEIEEFMKLGYDYCGAPWEESQAYWFYTTKGFLYERFHIGKKFLLRVGNGGFSLRKIDKTIELLKNKWLWKILWGGNEDFFFALYGLDNQIGFQVAPLENARKFALETDIRKNLESGLHPFAVHKWQAEYNDYAEIEKYILHQKETVYER